MNTKYTEYNEENFPTTLNKLKPPLEKLYYLGDPELAANPKNNISIVGTRKASAYGRFLVEHLIKHLSQFEVNIISGLADGIDSFAHQLALDHGLKTIAVLGSGLENLNYLNSTQVKLFERINANSENLILSQFEPKQGAALWTFPKRNWVIAGLSQATIVIEASEKSGSLITAEYAVKLNLPVFTFPGELWKSNFKGNNFLISSEKALAIYDLNQLNRFLGLKSKTTKSKTDSIQVSLFEKNLLDKLKLEPISLDELIILSKSNTSELLTQLTLLEVKGLVRRHAGGKFSRKS